MIAQCKDQEGASEVRFVIDAAAVLVSLPPTLEWGLRQILSVWSCMGVCVFVCMSHEGRCSVDLNEGASETVLI